LPGIAIRQEAGHRERPDRIRPEGGDRPLGEAGMAGTSPIEQAIHRLQSAMDRLDSAVERNLDNQRKVSGLEGEMQRLGTDRSRLAQSLDAAEERSGQLEEANREVSRRLVGAMESIREVLARNGAA
jgi:predicted  nucleic acid-binding Zn-ribbon protein